MQPPPQTKENKAGMYKLTAIALTTSTLYQTSIIISYITTYQTNDLQHIKLNFGYSCINTGTIRTPPRDKKGKWAIPVTGKISINGQLTNIVSFSGTALVLSRTQAALIIPPTFKSTLTKQ